MRYNLFVLVIVLLLLPEQGAFGATQAVTGYTHDVAGNTTRIRNETNNAAPTVTLLDPSAVRRVATNRIIAFGTNLKNAQVAAAEAGIQTATISSTSGQVVFDLTAAATVAPGDYPLTFTTRLGSATATITITDALAPQLSVSPNPITLGSNGGKATLSFTLSAPDSLANTLTFTIADPLVAQISPAGTIIEKDATHSSDTVTVTGLIDGKTTLTVNASQLNSMQIPIEVVKRYQFPPGTHTISSATLGINRAYPPAKPVRGDQAYTSTIGIVRAYGPAKPVKADSAYSTPLGIVRTHPAAKIVQADTAYSQTIGIVRASPEAVPVKADTAYTKTLGIVRASPEAAPVKADTAYAQIGVFWGASIAQVTPTILLAGYNNPLNLFGQNLQLVTQIALDPADGAIVDPAWDVSPDGAQLSVHISIAPGTSAAQRKLVVTTSKGPARFIQLDSDKVNIQ